MIVCDKPDKAPLALRPPWGLDRLSWRARARHVSEGRSRRVNGTSIARGRKDHPRLERNGSGSENGGLATQIAGAIHRNLELVGKYLGEFAQHQIRTTVSVLVQPEYLQMRAALVRALQPYPDARAAVAAMLHQIESKAAERPPAPPMIEGKAEAVADA